MEKLRAVIYIRVSDQSQVDNNSLETQFKSCQAFADANNLEVVKVFSEEGFSAKTMQRPEMRKLLSYCTLKGNKIARVIVYKMDRWTRNVEEGLLTMSLLARYGTVVVPATEIADQTPMGKAIRTILMAMGELDNGLKSERVTDNMKTMFQRGFWCWKPPIGYKRPFKTKEENKGKSVVIDQRIGKIIKSVFEKAAELPISKKELASYANILGFGEIYGKPADGRTISRIISDTFYHGYMHVEKWDEYAWGKYEILVGQEVWQKANINVFGRSKKYKHQENWLFPLKGLLNCFSCNHPMTSSNPKGTTKNYLYYECHFTKCEKHQRVGVDKAHEQFKALLNQIRPSERVLKIFSHLVFSEWDKSIEDRKREADLIDLQIKKLEDKLLFIAEANSKRILTDDEAQSQADTLRTEISVLKIERTDIKVDQYDTQAVKNFTENFLVHLDNLWEEMDLTHKQALHTEIFSQNLIVENGEIRTNGLASTFKLIEDLSTENIKNVTPPEFESGSSG